MKESKEDFIRKEGNAFPGATYAKHLLEHVFLLQRDHLSSVMFDVHRAHTVMLLEADIIDIEEAGCILQGLDTVSKIQISSLQYDSEYEDLFFLLEQKIGEEIGHDLAGNMHIAKSRNDMGVTMYRMVLRKYMLELANSTLGLAEAVLHQAEEQKDTIIPAYTHTQPAQPITLGHYLLAVFDGLMRDIERLLRAFKTVNLSPLGAAALSTTGFPINRERTAELLGFDGVVENSYDAIAGGDYLVEGATAVLSLMTNTGRWIQDFLLYVTKEFNAISIADPYVQISSIMPQKRNPVSVEHSRALASSSAGEALTVLHMIHNTPFGDIVDTEDDLQPHLYRSYEKANRVVLLMNAVIRTMNVNKEMLHERAAKHCITITELADVLARDKHIPFRTAHKLAGEVAKACTNKQCELYELSAAEVNQLLERYASSTLTDCEWKDIISPDVFVSRRSVRGGPNIQEAERMIIERNKTMQEARHTLEQAGQNIKKANNTLIARIQEIIKEQHP
ncbi:argininosuccinate lyase [Bacillus sp. 165]|uniref:argininosuccinate lyase n=1 Tax=Bacillus sp. 165 TaxID=1529117 RepID=UPI001FFE1FFC|nr:argininosuccinate lyase [Bacillus sp. 165]